ncbi:MAG: acyl-CoA dehydrogenase, partial [Oxalobacteraceae bacterium]
MTEEAFDLALLQQWVGRTEVKQDVIQPGMAEALAATLDR